MNRQETFNKMYIGLIKQGGPSVCATKCMYRSETGRKCAAGHVMDDRVYRPVFEGYDVSDVTALGRAVIGALLESGVERADIPMVAQVQAAHDAYTRGADADDVTWLKNFQAWCQNNAPYLNVTIPEVST